MEPESLLDLAETAAMEGEYEAAYHLLMATLHVVEHRRDTAAIRRVVEAGRRIGAAVEAVTPPHRLARQHAQTRGQQSIFEQLEVHAEAVRLRLESDRLRARAAA